MAEVVIVVFQETAVTVYNVLGLFVAGEVAGDANLDEVLIEMESVKLSS